MWSTMYSIWYLHWSTYYLFIFTCIGEPKVLFMMRERERYASRNVLNQTKRKTHQKWVSEWLRKITEIDYWKGSERASFIHFSFCFVKWIIGNQMGSILYWLHVHSFFHSCSLSVKFLPTCNWEEEHTLFCVCTLGFFGVCHVILLFFCVMNAFDDLFMYVLLSLHFIYSLVHLTGWTNK